MWTSWEFWSVSAGFFVFLALIVVIHRGVLCKRAFVNTEATAAHLSERTNNSICFSLVQLWLVFLTQEYLTLDLKCLLWNKTFKTKNCTLPWQSNPQRTGWNKAALITQMPTSSGHQISRHWITRERGRRSLCNHSSEIVTNTTTTKRIFFLRYLDMYSWRDTGWNSSPWRK